MTPSELTRVREALGPELIDSVPEVFHAFERIRAGDDVGVTLCATIKALAERADSLTRCLIEAESLHLVWGKRK